MNPRDFAESVINTCGRMIEAAIDASSKSTLLTVSELVDAAITKLPVGEKGDPGKDAEPVDQDSLLRELVALIPAPVSGKDAAPVDLDAVALAAAALIPPPVNGKDAEPVDTDAIAKDVLAMIPVPKDGKDADHMQIVRDVLALIPLPRDGHDGIASRDELAALVNAKVAEVVAEVVPRHVAEETARRPDVRYCDVWRDGNDYREGNFVTFGGSVWHCNANGTKQKPGDGGNEWTLAVKKGRDK